MNDAAEWGRVVEARTAHAERLAPRVWALREDGREAAINLRPLDRR